MNSGWPWLTTVLLLPLGGAVLSLLMPRSWSLFTKWFTVGVTLATAVIVWTLVWNLNGSASTAGPLPLHYDEQHSWISAIGAGYHLGIDGVAAWFLALNAGVFLLGALVISRRTTDRLKFWCFLLLLTEVGTTGVLLSADLLLFYFFWEAMLIPLYFLLSNWGTSKRGPATLKFVVYTVAGSLLMLISIIYLYLHAGVHSFDVARLMGTADGARLLIPGTSIATFTPMEWAFLGFAAAFAIKVPLVPFHSWLPDSYEAAPPQALVFFAGIVSKLGAFGFIRYGLTLFPGAVDTFKWFFAALAVLSIVYAAMLALSETDIKRIVAYASISHLGFIVLGIFSVNANGINGAVIQVVNHGIIIAALFLIVGWIEEKTGTRDLRELAGLEKRTPWLYGFFLIATLAGLGMPGMNSFVGEFTILLGAFQFAWIYAVLASLGVVLACWYMLRLHQGLMHDPLQPRTEKVTDISTTQGLLLLPLVALMVLLGIFPRPIGDVSHPSVQQYVHNLQIAQNVEASTTTGQP